MKNIRYFKFLLYIPIIVILTGCVGTDSNISINTNVNTDESNKNNELKETEQPADSNPEIIIPTETSKPPKNEKVGFILEILKKYSPDGYEIMNAYRQTHIFSDSDISAYIKGLEPSNWLRSIDTVVHEICHGYQSGGYAYNYYISVDESIHVDTTEVFPSADMAQSFPEELITFRFDTYIKPNDSNQSTQINGIYGLMGELNAYFNGTRATFNLYPYYLENGDNETWLDYFAGVYGTLYGVFEFKLYILKYLIYAEQYEKEIYTEIMENDEFKEAFIKIHENIYIFLEEFFTKKHELFDHVRNMGFDVSETNEYTFIKEGFVGSGCGNFIDIYLLLAEEMQGEEYMDMMSKLGFPDPDRAYPDPMILSE